MFLLGWKRMTTQKMTQIQKKTSTRYTVSVTLGYMCRLLLDGVHFNQKEDDYWQTLAGTTGHIHPASEFIKARVSEV